MNFAYSDKVETLRTRIRSFIDDHIVPRIRQYNHEVASGTFPVSFIEDRKALAKEEGLWNLFLPHLKDDEPGTRLTNLEYAPLADHWTWGRALRYADGPDEVHLQSIARIEIKNRMNTLGATAAYLTPPLDRQAPPD